MLNEVIEMLYTQFDFTNMYHSALFVSKDFLGVWSVSILAIGAGWRVMEESFQLASGQANYYAAAQDIIIASILVGGYLIFWSIFSGFYGSIAEALSLNDVLFEVFDKFESNLKRSGAYTKDKSLFTLLSTSVLSVFAWGFWYITAIVMICVDIFLNFAHAIFYSLCAISGTVIIPLAVLKNKGMVWNWVRLSTIVLVWPITFGILIWLMLQSIETIPALHNQDPKLQPSTLSTLIKQSIINIMIIAIQYSSITITQGLVAASSNLTSMATPFMAGGAIAGISIGNALKGHITRQHKSSKGGLASAKAKRARKAKQQAGAQSNSKSVPTRNNSPAGAGNRASNGASSKRPSGTIPTKS